METERKVIVSLWVGRFLNNFKTINNHWGTFRGSQPWAPTPKYKSLKSFWVHCSFTLLAHPISHQGPIHSTSSKSLTTAVVSLSSMFHPTTSAYLPLKIQLKHTLLHEAFPRLAISSSLSPRLLNSYFISSPPCDIVIYKKYIGHSFMVFNIFLLYMWSSCFDSWLSAPTTFEISWTVRAIGASFVIIFGLLSSVP